MVQYFRSLYGKSTSNRPVQNFHHKMKSLTWLREIIRNETEIDDSRIIKSYIFLVLWSLLERKMGCVPGGRHCNIRILAPKTRRTSGVFVRCARLLSSHHPFHNTCNSRSWNIVTIQSVHKIRLLTGQLISGVVRLWRGWSVVAGILRWRFRRCGNRMPDTWVHIVCRWQWWDQKVTTWWRLCWPRILTTCRNDTRTLVECICHEWLRCVRWLWCWVIRVGWCGVHFCFCDAWHTSLPKI